jgi:CxxC-x17-CxxC domain-containing protein
MTDDFFLVRASSPPSGPRPQFEPALCLQKFEYTLRLEYTHAQLNVSEPVSLGVVFEIRRFHSTPVVERNTMPALRKSRESGSPRVHSRGETAMPDLEITCSECNTPFTFSEREQEYYRERNLTHPKRCKPCRDARRANFGGSRGPGGERQRFEITCDQCGKTDSVPFKPSTGRPVLCSDCFSASRATQQRT